MDYNSMTYGFVFTLLGMILGATIGVTIISINKKKEDDIWKARYDLLVVMHAEQYGLFMKQLSDTKEFMKAVKMPEYITCNIIHERLP